MTTHTFSPALGQHYTKAQGHSIVSRFTTWCNKQQHNRMLWQAIILTLHGCVLTPVTMLVSIQGGTDNYLYIPVIAAMAVNLVPNLAALPTKITIPVFLLSIVMDLVIIAAVLL